MIKKGIVYNRNKFVDIKKAIVPLADLGFQRGCAVFEAMRSYDGKSIFALPEHLIRLKHSAKAIGIKLPNFDLIRIKSLACVRLVGGESLIRLFVTAGDGDGFYPFGKPQIYIICVPFPTPEGKLYNHGVSLKSVVYERESPQAKTTNYAMSVKYYLLAKREGRYDAVYLDKQGYLLEGTTFNLAVVKNNTIYVPSSGVLRGVTMDKILALARKDKIRVVQRGVKYTELARAGEVFITSTIREIMPVVRIDSMKIGEGQPGRVYARLHSLFKSMAR